MISPIKLILAGLLVLVSACGESANQEKPLRLTGHAVQSSEASGETKPTLSSRFVAGLVANQRPANAPTIREFTPGNLRRKQMLTGISEPLPASLAFIDDQEAWYTPFNQPGIPGYYDLRNWHDNARDSNHASW